MRPDATPLPYPELNVHLLRRPKLAEAGSEVMLRGRQVPSLNVPQQASTALSIDFDTLQSRLANLPRMFLELDGSFMWAGESSTMAWRIDGMVYENAQTVQWVEIKGHCPLADWQELLSRLGHATEPLMVLWLPEQFFLDVDIVRCCY